MAWALKLPLTDEVIESGLVQDFDASLSGIGQELGAGAYSMRYCRSFGRVEPSALSILWDWMPLVLHIDIDQYM